MELTSFLARIIGPILLLRGVSVVVDRGHFVEMIEGLDREVKTISFSMVPVAILAACIALANSHRDYSSPAALLIHVIAWAGMLKASALILFPQVVVRKAQLLGQVGFVNVVLVSCFLVGGYLTWFGYFA